jgi:hypothetical protein
VSAPAILILARPSSGELPNPFVLSETLMSPKGDR